MKLTAASIWATSSGLHTVLRAPKSISPQAIVALAATALFIALHWRGIPLSPDGWSYWQAAISIANGTGYRNFEGAPIVAWPPLYSLYLSGWVRLSGPSGVTLVAANGMLIVIQALLWYQTLVTIWQQELALSTTWLRSLIALYIGLFVPLTLQAALSENLSYIFFATMTMSTWQVINAEDRRSQLAWLAAFATTATLGLLSHNLMLVLLLSCIILIARFGRPPVLAIVPIALAFAFPISIWWGVRSWLGQTRSHVVDPNTASFGTLEYVAQMGFTVGNLIVPSAFGAPIIAALLLAGLCMIDACRRVETPRTCPASFIALLTAAACVQTVLLFSLTYVADPIGARFVAWVPILLVSSLVIRLQKHSPPLMVAIALFALAPIFHRAFVFAVAHPQAYKPNQVTVLFPINAYLSPMYLEGPSKQTERGLLVSPPK